MRSDAVAAQEPTAADRATPDGFAAWVEPHWTVMAKLARRWAGTADGEDVLQEALAVAWRKRDRFDPTRGTPRSWLLALVADQARKTHRRKRRDLLPMLPTPTAAEQPDERQLDLERAIAELSGRQRLAVDLYYFLDLPINEVSAVMRCSEGTVKSTLSDARRRLREQLGDAP